MNNIRFDVAYNGSEYHGWQIQPNKVTVQKILSDTLSGILGQKGIIVRGAGRTDSGVHAVGQVCSAMIENLRIPIGRLENIYNKKLPQTIKVFNMQEVQADFHPTINAKAREYCYRISHNKDVFKPNVFYCEERFQNLDVPKLDSLFSFFEGTNNFETFSKSATNTDNFVCIVEFAKVEKSGSVIEFRIKANRFVYNMVRRLVGTVLEAHDKGLGRDFLELLVAKRDRQLSGKTMPACGLTLEKVYY